MSRSIHADVDKLDEGQSWGQSAPVHALIPDGVADYFWRDARQRLDLASDLLHIFRRWGYSDVIPPAFEYAASLEIQASEKLKTEMVRFLDRDGSTLALRPEFTTPVARLVGTRLHDLPMPQRFCYAGSAFRYVEPQAGRQREFWQAGVELIGADSPDADGEIVALTLDALDTAGLNDVRIVLGQIGYFQGLLQELDLSPQGQAELRWAIERKAEAALEDFLRDRPLRTGQRQTVEALPDLEGPDFFAVLDRAARFSRNRQMSAAISNLRAIGKALAAYGVLDRVILDLTEIRNLGYYTGITFEVLSPSLGSALGSGGRYDDLVGRFGPPQPAVGVALGLERMLLARERGEPRSTAAGIDPIDKLVVAQGSVRALEQVRAWRDRGERVQVEVKGRRADELLDHARAVGAAQLLIWTGDRFEQTFLDPDAQPAPGAEALS